MRGLTELMLCVHLYAVGESPLEYAPLSESCATVHTEMTVEDLAVAIGRAARSEYEMTWDVSQERLNVRLVPDPDRNEDW